MRSYGAHYQMIELRFLSDKPGLHFVAACGRYELSGEMQQACDVVATYLVDSTKIQTKQLVSLVSHSGILIDGCWRLLICMSAWSSSLQCHFCLCAH